MSKFYRTRPERGRHVPPPEPGVTPVTVVQIQGADGTLAVEDSTSADPTSPDGVSVGLAVHSRAGLGQLTADLQVHSLLEELLEELRVIRKFVEAADRRK